MMIRIGVLVELTGILSCAFAIDTPSPFEVVLKPIRAEAFRNPRLDINFL